MGKACRLSDGTDVAVVANGAIRAQLALEASGLLRERSVSCRVASMPAVKPLDLEEVSAPAEETGAIATVEERSVCGGLGGAIAEAVVSSRSVPIRITGLLGFLPTGSAMWLLEHFGLTGPDISSVVVELLERK
jgi:transketolase